MASATSPTPTSPSPTLTVVLVDDEQLARDELRYLLEQQPEAVDIVAQASNGVEALSTIEQIGRAHV